MPWITPRRMNRPPGTPGLVVKLIDVSGSMTGHKATIAREMVILAKKLPRFRLAAFSGNAREIAPHRFAIESEEMCGGTEMHLGLRLVAKWKPSVTIVMSDGVTSDTEEVLKIAAAMTGNIFSFYCGPEDLSRVREYSLMTGGRLMVELARIGNGKCLPLGHDLDPAMPAAYRSALHNTLQPILTHQGGDMKRYPDHYIQGNQIDFRQPARRSFTMTQHIDVHHETIVNHIRHAPRQIEHGEHGQQTVYIQGAQINMHQAPAEQRQQVTDRGQVVEVRHQHAALPKPGIRLPGTRPHPQQLALPAPTRAQNGHSLGLPVPQQQPMQRVTARASVLAAFNQQARKR